MKDAGQRRGSAEGAVVSFLLGGAVQLREPHTELVTLGMSGQPGWEGCLRAKGCFTHLTRSLHGCLLKAKQTNTLKSVL